MSNRLWQLWGIPAHKLPLRPDQAQRGRYRAHFCRKVEGNLVPRLDSSGTFRTGKKAGKAASRASP